MTAAINIQADPTPLMFVAAAKVVPIIGDDAGQVVTDDQGNIVVDDQSL